MSRVEKISIAITPEMATNIKEIVNSGEFASSSEIVRTALREWQERRDLRAKAFENIGKLWDEGVSGVFHNADDVFAELDQILEDEGSKEKAA